MGKSGRGQDVRKRGREPGVGGRLRVHVELRLMRRLTADERRLVRVLAMDQRDEAEVA